MRWNNPVNLDVVYKQISNFAYDQLLKATKQLNWLAVNFLIPLNHPPIIIDSTVKKTS